MLQEAVTQIGTTSTTDFVWGNELIQQSRGGQGTYYHADAQGSTKVLTDASGAMTDTYSYEAFGDLENKFGTTVNSYRYTGEYFDEAVGLQYNRARWYDAGVSRFVSVDPYEGDLTEPSSLHRYGYASMDPVNNMDPTGEMSMASTGAAGSGNAMLASIAQPAYGTIIRKFLIGNPKSNCSARMSDAIRSCKLLAIAALCRHATETAPS